MFVATSKHREEDQTRPSVVSCSIQSSDRLTVDGDEARKLSLSVNGSTLMPLHMLISTQHLPIQKCGKSAACHTKENPSLNTLAGLPVNNYVKCLGVWWTDLNTRA